MKVWLLSEELAEGQKLFVECKAGSATLVVCAMPTRKGKELVITAAEVQMTSKFVSAALLQTKKDVLCLQVLE